MDAEFGEYNVSKVAGLGDLGGRQDLNDPDAPLLSLKGWNPALAPDVTVGLQMGYDFFFSGGQSPDTVRTVDVYQQILGGRHQRRRSIPECAPRRAMRD